MLRLFVYSLLCCSSFAQTKIESANPLAEAIDQRPIHENGCGPISLLNAYRFSSSPWRDRAKALSRDPEKQFTYITNHLGRKISRHAYQRQRWEETSGMRPRDLHETINDLHKKAQLPALKFHSLYLKKHESHTELLQRLHKEISRSLEHGFPPILHLARFAKIPFSNGGYRWGQLQSHFVIITEVHAIDDGKPLSIQYIDPWGAKTCQGTIATPTSKFFANDMSSRDKNLKSSPCLQALFPQTHVGNHLVATKMPSVLTAGHLISAHSAPKKLAP